MHPDEIVELNLVDKMNNTDLEYQRLLRLILEKGRVKKNRTGTDTIGVFGAQARYDLQEGFPLLTTKKMAVKAIIHELLWFIKGDTNIKYLVDNGCNIWNGDCYRMYKKWCNETSFTEKKEGSEPLTQEEFIALIKENPHFVLSGNLTGRTFAQQFGDLGQGTYGQMWRAFPYYTTDEEIEDGEIVNTHYEYGAVDQLQKVIDKLKTNPDDRRIIVSAWHPYFVDHCALPPCHCLFHFNTEELTLQERIRLSNLSEDDSWNLSGCTEEELHKTFDISNVPRRRLNCLLYQRSCDGFLGIPFNIASYAMLLSMMSQVVNMVPGEFVHSMGDLHLYQNHIEQAKLQLTREPFPLPTLKLNPKVTNLFDFKIEDISIENYQSHPSIKGDVSTG